MSYISGARSVADEKVKIASTKIDLKRSTSSMGIVERIEYDPNRSSWMFWFFLILVPVLSGLLNPDFVFAAGDGASSSAQGVHIRQGMPIYDFWDHYWVTPEAQARYFSTQVHVPGEIEDPIRIERVGKLNGYLFFWEEKNQVRDLGYSKSIQLELDRRPQSELAATLQYFIDLEELRYAKSQLFDQLWDEYIKSPYQIAYVNRGMFDTCVHRTLESYNANSYFCQIKKFQVDLHLRTRYCKIFDDVMRNLYVSYLKGSLQLTL
ncbi:hypothetical protein Droror1_Dr00028105 [Drosera rotundifolia]